MNTADIRQRHASPYPGLRPFRQDEAELFFGRGEQVEAMLTKLETHRFLAVVGASGCGKSSLVRAGLLPAIEEGYLSNAPPPWLIVDLRPGDAPLDRLAEAFLKVQPQGDQLAAPVEHAEAMLAATLRRGPLGLVDAVHESHVPDAANVLLLVDQFEELFRFRERARGAAPATEAQRNEATAFVELLLQTARQTETPIYVVVTMRSDFLGDCDAFLGLPEAINDGQFLAPRLTRDQLAEVIRRPAQLFGARIDGPLVNRLLNQLGNDPDQLPVLQHALMRMWTRKQAGLDSPTGKLTLTAEDYALTGGLDDALSQHADEAYNSLDAAGQRIAEWMFRCLSAGGPDSRLTRRLATIQEIADVAQVSVAQVIAVAEAFRRADRCFLTPPTNVSLTAQSTLDISHESLLRLWSRVNDWVRAESTSREHYHDLCRRAELRQSGGDLLGRHDLNRFQMWFEREQPTASWATRYGGSLESAVALLKESADAIAEVDEQRRRVESRKRWAVITSLCVLAAFAAVLVVFWYQAKRSADLAIKAAHDADQARERATAHEQIANERYNLARGAFDTILTAVSDLEGLPNLQYLREQLLVQVLKDYKTLARSAGDGVSREVVVSECYVLMAQVHYALGEMRDCEETACDAIAAVDTLLTQDPQAKRYLKLKGDALFMLSRCRASQGRHEESIRSCEKAILEYKHLNERFPEDDVYALHLAMARLKFGSFYENMGDFQRGLVECQKAVATLDARVVTDPSDERYAFALADAHASVGWKHFFLLDYSGSKSSFEAAVKLFEKLRTLDFGNVKYRYELAESKAVLAVSLHKLGFTVEAERSFQESLSELALLADTFPDFVQYRKFDGHARIYHAAILGELGQIALAQEEFARSIQRLSELADEFPEGNLYYRFYAAYGRVLRARLFATTEKMDEAGRDLDSAIEDANYLLGKRPTDSWFVSLLAMALASRATVYESNGDYVRARECIDEAVNNWERVLASEPLLHDHLCDVGGPYALPLWRALFVLGDIQRQTGDVAAAAAAADRIVALNSQDPAAFRFAAKLFLRIASSDRDDADSKKTATEKSLDALKRAAELGFRDVGLLNEDSDLDLIRSDERFKIILQTMTKKH